MKNRIITSMEAVPASIYAISNYDAKKYAKKDTSGLKIKLEKGKNEKNFDLTD